MTWIILKTASEDLEANSAASGAVVNLNPAVSDHEVENHRCMVVNNYNFYHNYPPPQQPPLALISLSRAQNFELPSGRTFTWPVN